MARGKKRQIADATKASCGCDKRKYWQRGSSSTRCRRFRHVDVERPYTYTEQINHLKATVELGFAFRTPRKLPSFPPSRYSKPRRNPLPSWKM